MLLQQPRNRVEALMNSRTVFCGCSMQGGFLIQKSFSWFKGPVLSAAGCTPKRRLSTHNCHHKLSRVFKKLENGLLKTGNADTAESANAPRSQQWRNSWID